MSVKNHSRVIVGIVMCTVLTGITAPVVAQGNDEVSDLKETVKAQNEMIELLIKRVDALEDRKLSDVSAIPVSLKDIAPKAQWTERVRIKGDFRYRHEIADHEGARHADTQAQRDARATIRNRQRFRARVAILAQINDDIDFIFQLASGSADPTSTNQTFDTFFESKNVFIDLAYITWHPEEFFGLDTSGANVYAGKMKMPFHVPVKSEMIWDGDVRPEGIAAKHSWECGDMELTLAGGGFWIDEQTRDVDVNLWAVQGYAKAPVIKDDISLLGGITYYDYGGIQDHPVYNGNAQGNSTQTKPLNANTLYELDFQTLELFCELHFAMINMPWVIYTQYVNNLSTRDDNQGYQFGFRMNKCKEPGSWEFKYFWQRLEADAVLAAFPDSSFGGGGTDNQGHRFDATYQLAKHTQFKTAFYLTRGGLEDHTGKYHTLLQMDLKVKF